MKDLYSIFNTPLTQKSNRGLSVSQLALFIALSFLGFPTQAALKCSSVWILVEKIPVVEKHFFVTSRTLGEYIHILGINFAQDLKNLKPNDLWMDIGSGSGKALEEYLNSYPNPAQVLGITYKHYFFFDRWRSSPPYIQKGRYLEEYSKLPTFQLGSDVFGVFSYSKHLDIYFDLTLNALAPGGKLYIGGTLFHTTIVNRLGQSLSVTQWLQNVPGIEVQEGLGMMVITRKSSKPIHLPRLKNTKYDDSQLPPLRSFQVLDPS